MWHNTIKLLLVTLFLSISGSVLAQSQLPACLGTDSTRWKNCNGSITFPAGGTSYVGGWKDGKLHGDGVLYSPNGAILSQGFWENGHIIRAAKLNIQPYLTASVFLE